MIQSVRTPIVHLLRASIFGTLLLLMACQSSPEHSATTEAAPAMTRYDSLERAAISDPLVTDIYTADPSAHVFDGTLYIYPSHDVVSDIAENDDGDHFAMRDYRILSLAAPGAEVVDHGPALRLEDIPWASRQL
ncbi:hypothetical protein LEM8419_00486 [Neolewinella maritima]|uniref:Alpha-N-arabinofuranosidase n=1 Tax=Neolewinella maritima TaxID=1383882 RepID=A0ABN8EZC4_9BACT|nr:hypothetical protein [Neolewinella maritima]CAH0999189.1 hypothetical protein LEM8419_00486 [Neolewinella maritima]